MKNECTHAYEVKYNSLMTVRFACRKCGAVKHLSRKCACSLYLLGLVGWLPAFYFSSLELSRLLKLLLTIAVYLALNFALQFFFYKWLAAKKPAQLNRFIGEQDSL